MASIGFPFPAHQLVFVDEVAGAVNTYAGLTILSNSLLGSARIIDRTLNENCESTRDAIAQAVFSQYFGAGVMPRTCRDAWVVLGIAGYLKGLFIEDTFGANEFKVGFTTGSYTAQ